MKQQKYLSQLVSARPLSRRTRTYTFAREVQVWSACLCLLLTYHLESGAGPLGAAATLEARANR